MKLWAVIEESVLLRPIGGTQVLREQLDALRSAVDPTLPANGGAMRPVTVRAPAGSIVAARPPAAVGAGNVEVSQRVADVCLGALARAWRDWGSLDTSPLGAS